jgi:GNAT superfamily N-acetyltransferase
MEVDVEFCRRIKMKNHVIIISEFNNKSFKDIASMMIEELKRSPFNEKASLKAAMESVKFYSIIGKIFVATLNNKIIGAAIFKIEKYWEGSVIILEDLIVIKEFENKNVDGKLLENIEQYAKRNSIKSINFQTKKYPSINKYRKLGYKIRKDIISMEKKIKNK